jgi:hypothetical protein
MASSITAITAAKAIGDCTAYLLNGQHKIVAEGLVAGEEVTFYHETSTEGNYQIVYDSGGRALKLEPGRDSDIFTLAGNYKFLLGANTNAARKVGYAAV